MSKYPTRRLKRHNTAYAYKLRQEQKEEEKYVRQERYAIQHEPPLPGRDDGRRGRPGPKLPGSEASSRGLLPIASEAASQATPARAGEASSSHRGAACNAVKPSGSTDMARGETKPPASPAPTQHTFSFVEEVSAGSTTTRRKTRTEKPPCNTKTERLMRYRELCAAEERYLIANGWHSTKVRGLRLWKRDPSEAPLSTDNAVLLQKQRDRELIPNP